MKKDLRTVSRHHCFWATKRIIIIIRCIYYSFICLPGIDHSGFMPCSLTLSLSVIGSWPSSPFCACFLCLASIQESQLPSYKKTVTINRDNQKSNRKHVQRLTGALFINNQLQSYSFDRGCLIYHPTLFVSVKSCSDVHLQKQQVETLCSTV